MTRALAMALRPRQIALNSVAPGFTDTPMTRSAPPEMCAAWASEGARMMQAIDTGLPPLAQPFSWAVRASGMVFTTHGPVRPDGRMELGAVEVQTRLTLDNLRQALQAAGGDLVDVAQVLIYLTDIADMPAVDAVYRDYFRPPYPNRSAVAVSALAVPGMRIELVAYACLAGDPPPRA